MERKLIIFIAMSLDGYIATKDDSIDFLSMVERPGEDYGYVSFTNTIDTVVLGRKTYDKVLTLSPNIPYEGKKVFVLSKSQTEKDENKEYHNDVVKLIKELKSKEGKDIYCDGGGEVIHELLQHSLIDRFIVSIIPHLLGDGKKLFNDGRPEGKLEFKQSLTFPSGLVQLWYDKKV